MSPACVVPGGRLGCPKQYQRYTTASDTYVHGLYPDLLEDKEARTYLGEEGHIFDFNEAKWSVPTLPTSRGALVESLYTILLSVMAQFVKSRKPGVQRYLVNTQSHPESKDRDENGYPLWPTMLVPASGPSFQLPEGLRDSSQPTALAVGFSGIATFFIVNLEVELGSTDEQVDEMETYARRVLLNQPNRRFVRGLVLTQTYARLLHFDRAGAEVSPPYDFHQRPVTFIRLVAGLCSVDERVLGFDTSVQWTEIDGRKDTGTITTSGKAYRIAERLRTPRNEVRGRATTCWHVQDPDTLEDLIVKDSWRPDDRRGEYEILDLVKGIPGLAQVVSYEASIVEIKDFRCPSTSGHFQNRVATRVTTKMYGRSIEHFTSPLQLLCAIRDAIAGHRKLVSDDLRVLHRDVAPQNVLLGRDGAPEGERGILIDFDLAFRATDGLRIFQSLFVLSSEFKKRTPMHDYLDDLESFFYILAYITLLYRPDGGWIPITDEGPSLLRSWSDDSAGEAFTNKESIFSGGPISFHMSRLVEGSWGPVFKDLFVKFHAWTLARVSDKEVLAFQRKGPEHLLPHRDEYYSTVLEMFDQAIAATKASSTISANEETVPSKNASDSSSTTPSTPPQPRRSAHLRNLGLPQPRASSGALPSPINATTPACEPRRSARIEKRTREREEETTGAPRSKP